jgi:AAA domain/Domain of unknown function (DUF3854)
MTSTNVIAPGRPVLSEEHLRSLVEGSGIHPVVAQNRGYATVHSVEELITAIGRYEFDIFDSEKKLTRALSRPGFYGVTTTQPGKHYPNDPWDVTIYLQYGADGDACKGAFVPAQLRLPALLIPTWWDGRIVGHRLRPDAPRVVVDDKGKSRAVKYEQPTGLPIHLDGLAWDVISDPRYSLVITEGEKKADSLRSVGVPAIALTGVWCWQRDKTPLPEWMDIPLQGRWVFVVFDSDVMTNEHVRRARAELTEFLRGNGALVRWIELPGGPDGHKFGIDDYLASGWPWPQIATTFDVDPNPLGFRSLADVRKAYRPPQWLIREVLTDSAFGVVGGAEKTLKSWIMIAITVALTSGRPLFCNERFTVTRRRRVVVLTGEGSVDLFLDRIMHLSQICGINYETDVEPYVHVTDKVKTTSSREFRTGLSWVLRDNDPGLVVLDPAYAYVAADDSPGNVFHMGQLLDDLRELCGSRAVLIGHHFTKAGADELSLSSLSQAGFREIFDHWILVAHAEDPDLVAQRFKLRARVGGRRGFGFDATFAVDLGPLDLDTLRHVGVPSWGVLAPTPRGGDGTNWRRIVYQDIRDHPWELTQKDLMVKGDNPGSRRTALEWLRDKAVVRTERRNGPNGERKADRYGPMFDLDVDTVATLPGLGDLAASLQPTTNDGNEESNSSM